MVLFTKRGGITSQSLGVFCWLLFFAGITFHIQIINSTLANCHHNCNHRPPLPPQVNHELTCCQIYEGYKGGKAEQDKYWGDIRLDSKGWRYSGEDQGGGKQEDKEGIDKLCLGCGLEEEVSG